MSSPGRPGPAKVAWAAIRPATLGLSVAPVVLGTAMALAQGYPLNGPILAAAVLTALLIQIGTNLHNDAADGLRGTDRPGRLGPLRVTAAGWASARHVLQASKGCFIGALCAGAVLAFRGGWPIVLAGTASLWAAWAYSGGRRPVSHSAWGEVFVLVFFGWVAVMGSHWLQAGETSSSAWVAGWVAGLPAAAVLLINNLRDRQADHRAGRRTLALRLAPQRSAQLYSALLLLPYPCVAWLAWRESPACWLACATAPLAWRMAHRLRRAIHDPPGPWMNATLAATARLALLGTLLLSAGLLAKALGWA